VRIWRGWTRREDADRFEERVRAHAPTLTRTRGLQGMHLLRSDGLVETEFVTVTRFASLDDVVAFAGNDYAKAVIPENLRGLIVRVDDQVRHYALAAALECRTDDSFDRRRSDDQTS
jgi:heme-degrading monooxygenase HmoA